jgi:hypothetical protein
MGGKPQMVAASRLLVGSTSLSPTIPVASTGRGDYFTPSDGADSGPLSQMRLALAKLSSPANFSTSAVE